MAIATNAPFETRKRPARRSRVLSPPPRPLTSPASTPTYQPPHMRSVSRVIASTAWRDQLHVSGLQTNVLQERSQATQGIVVVLVCLHDVALEFNGLHEVVAIRMHRLLRDQVTLIAR